VLNDPSVSSTHGCVPRLATVRAAAVCAVLSLLSAACTKTDAAPDAALLAPDSGPASPDASDAQDAARSAIPEPDAGPPRPAYRSYPSVEFPTENPFSAAKAQLGKLLFWDEQLSADDSVACGTCHQPAAGGSDPRTTWPDYVGHPGEDGVRGTFDDPHGSLGLRRCERTDDGRFVARDDALFGDAPQVTRRRAMSALDAMFWPDLFWDGRASDAFVDPEQPDRILIAEHGALESQAVAPLQNSAEMSCDGFRWSDLTAKLARVEPLALATALPDELARALSLVEPQGGYPTLFENAFGSPAITPARIAFAIATYERTLTADQTPWDRAVRGEPDALTPAQQRGSLVFLTTARCACCHPPPLFGSAAYGRDGFSESVWDAGRFEVTGTEADRAAFRVPSLRGVGLREAGGLLHDGVGAGRDLDTLLQHYNDKPLFPSVVGLCVRTGAYLSAEQLADLSEFLRGALTDPRAAAEAPPFDRPRLRSEAR